MKILALLILVGVAAATTPFDWKPGHKYEFKYSGRVLTGLPGLSTQYSGLAINASVLLYVKDPEQFYLTVKNPKYVAVNHELQPQEGRTYDEGNNWRKLRLPELSPVSGEFVSALESPISFRLGETGGVKEVKVKESDPLWATNFKKALVTLFQAKLQSGPVIDTALVENRPYWTVKEQSIMGECETSYQVNKIPEYIIRDEPSIKPRPDACKGQEYFEIVRTINYDKCDRFSSYRFYGTGEFPKCASDTMTNCNNLFGRTTSVRYLVCGSRSSGKLSIQTIINDGEMNTRLQGHRTETVVTGTHQNLTLVEVQSTSNFPEPSGPRETDLLFDLVKVPKPMMKTPEVLAKSHPINFFVEETPRPEEIGQKIKELLEEMSKNVHGVSGTRLSESQIGMKLLTVAKGIALLKTPEEIKSVYNQLQSSEKIQETSKQFFLDACAISGTPQAIEFFIQSMASIKDSELTHFFLWLPHNVITPTQEVLEKLFHFITSEHVKSKPYTYNIAITGLTQLIQQGCISQNRLMQYPSWIFGELCTPESSVVQEKLIPYLSKESRLAGTTENHKNIHIVALGMLSHKNVIGELTPIVEQSETHDEGLRRVLALYSLAKVGRSHPDLVVPIFQALFTNPTESHEVRIISFNSLLRLNPPTHVFNTIAHTTRQEPSMSYELLKTINIALYTLGNPAMATHLPIEDVELMKKCKDAYVIVRKIYGITPSSGTYYVNEFMKDFGVGYQGFVNWVSSQESVLPRNVFVKLNLFMESMYTNAVEIGYRLSGVDSLYEKVSDSLNGGSLIQKIHDGLSSEWKEAIEKMNLKDREPSKSNGFVYARAFGSGVFLKSFTESTTEFVKEKIVEMIKSPSMDMEHKLNLQKSFVMNSYVMVVPSEMGFPIDTEIHTPVTVSLTGQMKLDTDKSSPSIRLDSKLLYTSQMTGWVGTLVPFTKEYVVTGVDKHLLYNVPGSLRLSLDIPEQKVSVTIKPEYESKGGETDIWHFHVMPYTAKQPVTTLTPLTKSQNFKLIKSSTPVKSGSYKFGERLGLSLKGEYKSESVFTDVRSFIDVMKMYNYCPWNMMIFQYTAPAFDSKLNPSLRQQRTTITMNPTESTTKEVQMEFKVGYASKLFNSVIKYHSLKSISNSERFHERDVSPSITSLVMKVLPYRVRSERIDSVSHHQTRVQKLRTTMEGLGSTESSYAISLVTKIVLKGNRPRIFTYNLDIAQGRQSQETKRVEQKWNLKFEGEESTESWLPKKICLKGKLDLPLLPVWNIDELRTSLGEFYYHNKLDFGQSQCTESTILTKGVARTSNRQRDHALETPESKMCHQLMRDQVKGSQLSPVCQQAREQASALDQIEFTTEFNNVPKVIKYTDMELVSYLKAYLWPYYSFKASNILGPEFVKESYQTRTVIAFKQKTPSFDLTINRPDEVITFANVHVPRPFSLFFPLKGDMSVVSAVRKVTGSAIYPTCKVDHKTVITYDNQTVPLKSDGCYHLLTADCSKYKRFGVAVKNIEGGKKELKVFLKKAVVKMTPHGSEGPKVFVENEPIEVRPNQETVVKVEGKILATITRSVDGVVILKAPSLYLAELGFNGKLITVVPSPMLKNKLCGLCGDNNLEMNGDVAGPQKCVYSKPELKVASYRIPSDTCPPLPISIKQELRRETEQCSKYRVQPTKVAHGYKMNTGKCTLLRHLVMQKPGEVCISKDPITECGPSCKPRESELVEKSVSFACLPPGRLADVYVSKVNQGKPVEELENLPTAYVAKIKQPLHCRHALVSGSYYS